MSALKSLFPYFRPYRTATALGLLCVILASAFSSLLPWIVRSAIDALGQEGAAQQVMRLAWLLVAVAIMGGAFRFGMRYLMNGVSRKIEYDIRNSLFRHIVSLDARWHGRTRTGDIMARLTNDLSAVRMAAGPAIMYLASTVFGGIFAIGFMFSISPRLTGMALLPMVFLPIVMARLGNSIHQRFEEVQEQFSNMTVRAQENIAGVRIVRAYQQEEAEALRFADLNSEYMRRNIRLVKLWGVMHPLLALLAGLGAAVVLGVGGSLAVNNVISVGEFVAFTFYLTQLTWPLIALGWVINLFQRGAASMARLNEIMNADSVLRTADPPRALPPTNAGRTVEFRGVWFHYPSNEAGEPRWVLRDISFIIPRGGTLGVVGATGSGKSALLDLIPRLYDPQRGQVLVDGIPVNQLLLAELRSAIGYASQDSTLFSDTIVNNISYGGSLSGASLDAAKVASLDGDVTAFSRGYETMLGERGINLSGGQKQRTALARALARGAPVLILDDTLSAVDTMTESHILSALQNEFLGRTVIVSAHRISAVQRADHILVLHEGEIVEEGNHAALLALDGRYASLWRRQQLLDAIESTDNEPSSYATFQGHVNSPDSST